MRSSGGGKIGTAILATLGFLVLVRVTYVAAYEPRNLTRPVYILKGLVMENPPGGAPLPSEPLPDWVAALPAADLAAGQRLSRQCIGCHDLSPSMKTVLGPGLHGVVGRPRASVPGFAYSTAMRAGQAPWTPDALFQFLRNPQLYVSGTKMSFAGLPDRQQRIDLIAYLRANGS
jgi:cytochrome c